jgi:hypothetical protein
VKVSLGGRKRNDSYSEIGKKLYTVCIVTLWQWFSIFFKSRNLCIIINSIAEP